MKALVKHGHGIHGLGLMDVKVPGIGAEDALVAVKAAAICGTDLHIKNDAYPVDMPVTIGHEFSGVIEMLGGGVRNWKAGDRVIAAGNIENCGSCFCCISGNANLCKENKYLGIKVDGVFAKYVRIPARLLHKIPENTGFEEAALAEPAAVGIDALLGKNKVEVGDFLVVLGCGPIGLLAGQIAKAAGAAKVMITGRKSAVKTRFKVARELGVFDFIVNVGNEDPVQIVKDATGGKGADIIFDTTGSSAALNQGFEMVRRGGLVEAVGFGDKTVEIPLEKMIREVIRVHFCRGTTYKSFEIFCALASTGRLNLKPLISNKFPLADWEKGFEITESRDSVKTLLIP